MILLGEYAHNLDKCVQPGYRRLVPYKFDGAFAPCSGDKKAVVEVLGRVQVLEDVNEDFGGKPGRRGVIDLGRARG